MSWRKFFTASYWTGRSDLYLNSEKVEYVQNELTSIKGLVPPAQAEAQNALAAVNATLANTGYALDTSALDQVYSFIENMIAQIQSQITDKSNTATEYSKNHQGLGGVFQAGLGTVGMVLSKFGEGVCSAFEDVGDAVGTCLGWVEAATDAIGFTDKKSNTWADLVKKDLSHDLFHSINEATGINKHSYITEDSGIAGLSKTAGVATGYLTMSGWLGGAAKGYGDVRNGARFTKFLASSTNANTVMAGIGGLGSGTENGLQEGKSLGGASLQGLAQGVFQAGVAYGMGKLGEHIDRTSKIKAAESDVTKAEEAWKLANDEYSAALKAGDPKAISSAWKKLQQACLDEGAAKNALSTFQNTKVGWGTSSTYQGYTDPVSMKARQQGETFGKAWANNVSNAGGSGLKAAAKGLIKTEVDAVKALPGNAKTVLKTATINPATGKFSPVQTAKSTVKGAWNVATTPVKTTAGMIKHGTSTLGSSTGLTIARDALGVVAGVGVNDRNDTATHVFEARLGSKPTDTPPAPGDTTAPPTSAPPITTATPPPTTQFPEDNNNGGYYPSGGDDSPEQPGPEPITTTPPTTDPISTVVPTTEPIVTTPPTTQPPTETVIITPTSEPTVAPQPGEQPGGPGVQPVPGGGDDPGQHAGEGYSQDEVFGPDTDLEPELEDLVDDVTASIDDIINGKKYSKIPTSSTPIARPAAQSTGNAFIPIAAGLSAAAAAGLGAKAYMDKKHASDEDDDIYTDDWSDEDSIDVEYDDANAQEQYLDEDYNYDTVETEKYGARNNEELADLQ